MPEIASAKLSLRPELLPGAGARVLDVGCGEGRHIAAAAKRGCRAIGLDYDPAELRKTRGRGAKVDLVAGDATRLPFRDGAFDAVICTETLEHIADDRAAIGEMARVLRNGGTLHGAVPTHFTEPLYWKLSPSYPQTPGGHVRIYRPRTLIARLRAAGFRLVDVRFMHAIDSVLWLRFFALDFLHRQRRLPEFEAAVLFATALERREAPWRRRLRAAVPESRFLAWLDAIGAYVWPKSFTFTARKARVRGARARKDGSDDAT
jgi:SAM-dependent methyltransferase